MHVMRFLADVGAVLAAGTGALLDASTAAACGGDRPCAVAGGDYLAVPPPDGAPRPWPVVVFFHGWRSSGSAMVNNAALVAAAHRHGALFVAPNGAEGSWSQQGSPSQARDDLAFFEAVLDDVLERFPADPARVVVSGFSQGGSMAWDVACSHPERIAAALPIAGDFWRPHPERCRGPVRLRHVHGTSDQVVPMTGRPIGESWHHGDVRESVALIREEGQCASGPKRAQADHGLVCAAWTGCAEPADRVALCLYEGGHSPRAEWLDAGLAWAFGDR